jgi:hypothetical protein
MCEVEPWIQAGSLSGSALRQIFGSGSVLRQMRIRNVHLHKIFFLRRAKVPVYQFFHLKIQNTDKYFF